MNRGNARTSLNLLPVVWVPSLAHPTKLCAGSIAPPASPPPSARRAHRPATRRRTRSFARESRCAFPADKSAPAPDATETPGRHRWHDCRPTDHDEVRPQIEDRFQRGEPTESETEIAGRIQQPCFGRAATDKTVAARDPAAPRHGNTDIAVSGSAAGTRQRRSSRAISTAARSGCPVISPASRICCPLRRAFSAPRVRPDEGPWPSTAPASNACRTGSQRRCPAVEQHVLGASGQHLIAPGVVAAAIASRPAKNDLPEDLFGVGQRQQQLIGADVHRHHARQASGAHRAARQHQCDPRPD